LGRSVIVGSLVHVIVGPTPIDFTPLISRVVRWGFLRFPKTLCSWREISSVRLHMIRVGVAIDSP
jgi:hypothetical protein